MTDADPRSQQPESSPARALEGNQGSAADQPPQLNFEATLGDLESVVAELERGDLPLEASVAAFERGMQLSRSCRQALDRAEQRVRILLDEDREGPLSDFDAGSAA